MSELRDSGLKKESREATPLEAASKTDRYGKHVNIYVDGVPMHMRWIPPGSFVMGSPVDEVGRSEVEGPQHLVTISKGFWLADAPCTQDFWEAVVGNNPSRNKGDSLPVECVSWNDCMYFCESLQTQFEKQHSNFVARLPTEAEWEYACRAGTHSAFNDGSTCTKPSGHDLALEQLGWFNRINGETKSVRGKSPNAFGLYDMHGNVWEWCYDSRLQYTKEAKIDPIGNNNILRTYRGGSYISEARFCRCAYRPEDYKESCHFTNGFRLTVTEKTSVEYNSSCPLCGFAGNDLAFVFYCSNIKCSNYKK